ncbi:CopG family transcriptional regulator [Massilia arenosa]|uniref:CopG family transcriptional regulator n=1 Tax=Zemynaea arenosa TaxID=2561931 RepID=A0A4Y9SM88_9BURK|nr:CopG family transcriptional regulator [Massilia arenosa]TFW25554.1 CopG family transcriptional regulator [Massilia arenosa]
MKFGTALQRLPDSDKVTVNVGLVDLAQLDLLVQEGFYANRTDFVRTAIRNQLRLHADALQQTVAHKHFVLGQQRYARPDLEAAVAAGRRLEIQVLGLAVIDNEVTPDLADAAIASIHVLGAFVASPEVRQRLADRTHT